MSEKTEYMELVYGEIEKAMVSAQRELQRGVLPKDIQSRLPYARAEGSVRRDMANMVRCGKLVRIGGDGARRGYRLPTRMEKFAWHFMKFWPVGSERLVPKDLRVVIRRERQ